MSAGIDSGGDFGPGQGAQTLVSRECEVAVRLRDQAADLPGEGNRLRERPAANVLQLVTLEPPPGEDPTTVVVGPNEDDAVAAPHEEMGGRTSDIARGNGGDGRFVHLG